MKLCAYSYSGDTTYCCFAPAYSSPRSRPYTLTGGGLILVASMLIIRKGSSSPQEN